ncbi:hypothetical protein M408DRAFT_19953 [Serendipita vermifera MAFF 305830]|uniref:Uncharacterized protein n=1 Tax=Serendipita vermifera MAFF 305830 TaxID=933852 RepID=A0A0C2X2R5_SERVB|nr:hypothetical protein M408DRAFT_19953 [Serendipita vermifera MAFF 305830]
MYTTGHAVVHPRLSVLSTSSLPASATTSSDPNTPPSSRYSLPPVSSSSATAYSTSSSATAFTTSNPNPVAVNLVRPNIYDRPLNKTRNAEVSLSAFAFLFGEMVQYTQKRVAGIADFERKWGYLTSNMVRY